MTAMTRRSLLQAVAAWAALTPVVGCAPVPPIDTSDLLPTALAYDALLAAWFGEGDREGLVRLGIAYADALAGDLADDLNALLAGVADASDDATAVSALAAELDADLADADVVLPEGWVLGRAEARLCALAWVIDGA